MKRGNSRSPSTRPRRRGHLSFCDDGTSRNRSPSIYCSPSSLPKGALYKDALFFIFVLFISLPHNLLILLYTRKINMESRWFCCLSVDPMWKDFWTTGHFCVTIYVATHSSFNTYCIQWRQRQIHWNLCFPIYFFSFPLFNKSIDHGANSNLLSRYLDTSTSFAILLKITK